MHRWILMLGLCLPLLLIGQQQLIPFLSESFYGLSDDKGQILVEPAFEEVITYKEFDLIAFKQTGLWGIMDTKGNVIFKPAIKVENPTANYSGRLSGPIIIRSFNKIMKEENEIFTNSSLFKVVDDYAKVEYYFNPHTPQNAYTPFVDYKKIKKDNNGRISEGKPNQTGFIKVGTRDHMINFVDSSGQILFKKNVFDGEAMSREIIAVQNENGMLALFDVHEQPKSDFIYKKIIRDSDGEFIIAVKPDSIKKYTDYYSLYSTSGKLILSDQVHQMQTKGKTALVMEDRVASMYNNYGELVAKFENAALSEMIFEDDLFWISENGQYGIVDDKGNSILEPRYKSMTRFYNGKYAFTQKVQGGLLDEKFNPIWSLDSITISEMIYGLNGYYKIQKEIRKGYGTKNVYGIIDSLGKIIIPAIYNGGISYYPQSKVFGLWQDSLRSLIRLNGQVILPFTKSNLDVEDSRNSVFISSPEKSERLDMSTLKVTYLLKRRKRIEIMEKDNFYYLADEKKQPLFEPIYKSIQSIGQLDWSREVYIAKKLDIPKEFIDVYNDAGRSIIPDGYGIWNRINPPSFIHQGAIVVMYKEDVLRMDRDHDAGRNARGPYRSGVINFDGEWIIPPEEQISTVLGDGIIQTINFKSKKSNLYTRFGKLLTNRSYTYVQKIEGSDRYEDNRIIVGMPQDPAKYEQYANDLAQVTSIEQLERLTGEKNLPVILIGCIDISGKEVIPLKYSEIKNFRKGLTSVKGIDKGGKLFSAIIDTTGKELLRTAYDKLSISYEDSTMIYITKKELNGAMEFSGKVLLEPAFVEMGYKEKYRMFVVEDSIYTYAIPRDSPQQLKILGPATFSDVRGIGDDYFYISVYDRDQGEKFTHFHVFKVDGTYVGDYSGFGLDTKLFGAELPNGYIAVSETEDSKPYVVNLASGMKYKKN
ncbi:MAG: WG repeat-containing protein [Saprospiraceae bacterium]